LGLVRLQVVEVHSVGPDPQVLDHPLAQSGLPGVIEAVVEEVGLARPGATWLTSK
jgi:hypothetical protein